MVCAEDSLLADLLGIGKNCEQLRLPNEPVGKDKSVIAFISKISELAVLIRNGRLNVCKREVSCLSPLIRQSKVDNLLNIVNHRK